MPRDRRFWSFVRCVFPHILHAFRSSCCSSGRGRRVYSPYCIPATYRAHHTQIRYFGPALRESPHTYPRYSGPGPRDYNYQSDSHPGLARTHPPSVRMPSWICQMLSGSVQTPPWCRERRPFPTKPSSQVTADSPAGLIDDDGIQQVLEIGELKKKWRRRRDYGMVCEME